MLRMEESKEVDMLIHTEASMLVGMQILRQRHMEQNILEGMVMRQQRQQHSLQCKIQ